MDKGEFKKKYAKESRDLRKERESVCSCEKHAVTFHQHRPHPKYNSDRGKIDQKEIMEGIEEGTIKSIRLDPSDPDSERKAKQELEERLNNHRSRIWG